MMLLPYHVDVPMKRVPHANFVIIGATCIVHLLILATDTSITSSFLTKPWVRWFGSIFLHVDLFHLLGNMLALWVFGNAICAKVGNIAYVGLYIAFGWVAMAAHLVFDGDPALGASGAINGITGMFLVLYLFNEIRCVWLIRVLWPVTARFVSFSSGWLLLLWFIFDVWGAMRGHGNVGYWAHLGGFCAGFTSAVLLLLFGVLSVDRDERSLLSFFSSRY